MASSVKGSRPMNTKTRGIVAYLLITFGVAWLDWAMAWRLGVGATSFLFQLVSLPASFSPALAAIIVRRWITREGFADAGWKLHFRRTWPYYLFAWVLPLPVIGVLLVLAPAFGLGQADLTLHRGLSILSPGLQLPAGGAWLVLGQLMLTALVTTPVLWGEEFGWRSYLQIRLLNQRPLLAAIATGVIWGLWHYPIIALGYERYENPLVGLLIFPVLTILLSLIFGWLRLKTGSIWPSSLAHAATNSVGGSLSALLFVGGASLSLVGYTGILAWIPLGALCVWIVLSGQLKPEPAPHPQKVGVDSQ
jgi:membrane protease YdiL (CAAX protease family)